MAEAPAVDDTLTERDAGQIARELNEAQNESFSLGLELNLPPHEVEAIHQQHQRPRDRFVHVIIAFLKRTERPTWRVIVEALRSPTVGLPGLARRVEEAHFPDPTSTLDVVPEPVDTESAANTTATGDDDDEFKSKASSQQHNPVLAIDSATVAALQGEIKGFHRRFNSITESTVECLEKCRIAVVKVVFFLTSVLAVGEHKRFLEEKNESLNESKNHWILFGKLNLYWNPFSYSLFQGLLENLSIKNEQFTEINGEMTEYDKDMEKFRGNTKLVPFCKVAPDLLGMSVADEPPLGFRKMVVEHNWPETVTLKDVEEFRKQFSRTFGLPECAIMVHRIRRGSFTITWFAVVPNTVVLMLKKTKGVINVFRDFKVTLVKIDDEIVYQPSSQLPTPVSLRSQKHTFFTQVSHSRARASAVTHIPAKEFTSLGEPSFSSESSRYEERERFPDISTGKKEAVDPKKLLTVQCRGKKRAPCEMTRGSATTDGRFAYFTPSHSNSVYQYEYSTEKWEELPACPYDNSGLVIIDRELTAVGERDESHRRTNKLYTLRQREWVEKYPPMNTAFSYPAVVSTSDGEHIIVIGGWGRGGGRTTVELFQVKSRKWDQLTDLPQHFPWPSVTICGDLLHVIGKFDAKGYSCSLRSLPSSGDQPIPPQSLSWTPLPPLPVRYSTAATLCGQLVLIGGFPGGSLVNSIHQLVDGQWVEIGSMASARSSCLVVSPSPDKIIIVGGLGEEDSVEECVAMT